MSAAKIQPAMERDYPLLWEKAQEFDFAERLGGCTDPLMAEMDAAMREIWMARSDPFLRYRDKILRTLEYISDKSGSGDYSQVIADMATELLGDLGIE